MWHAKIRRFFDNQNFANDQDWRRTEDLKTRLADSLAFSPSHSISLPLFNEILVWKLRGQMGRQQTLRTAITPNLLCEITGCALRLQHLDFEILTTARMAVLQALPGVGMGVASAILTLTYPQDYGIIDFRVWELVFGRSADGRRKQIFTSKDYLVYLKAIRNFASEIGKQTQNVDYALWKAWEI